MILNNYLDSCEESPDGILFAARVDGRIRTTDFWEGVSLPVCSEGKDEKLVQRLSTMFPILEKEFPGNWDIGWVNNRDYYCPLIQIYFPQVNMIREESDGNISQRFSIKGVLISLAMTPSADFSNNIGLSRLSMTYKEYYGKYLHSHVTTGWENPMYINSFCLGRTDMNDILKGLSESTPENFQIVLEAFCFFLPNLISVESQSGGTYKNYQSLTLPGRQYYNTNLTQPAITRFINLLVENKVLFNVDYVYNDGIYSIKKNPKFNNFVKKLTSEWDLTSVLVVLDEHGVEYQIGESITAGYEQAVQRFYTNGQQQFTYIQGRKIEFEIEPPEDVEENPESYSVSRYFLKGLKDKLEQRLNERIFYNYIARTYNQGIFERIHNGEDPISVLSN